LADGQAQDAQQSDDLLPEVDFYDYLSAIDVEGCNADSEINFRDPAKKRRRNYKIYQITPIDAQENSSDHPQQLANRATRRKNRAHQSVHPDNDHQAVTHDEARKYTDDESTLMDAALNEQYNQIQSHMNPEINLHSQKDDPFFEAIINHLQTGALPNDRTLAQRILCQIDDYYIEDNQLWHLARLRGKRLTKIAPRFQQLCIPMQAVSDENHEVNSQHFSLFISEMLSDSQTAILLAGNGDRNGYINRIVSCLPTN
jgi:hypothetical protein